MPTREELHTLVDSLPEEAVQAAHRMLTSLQVRPPSPPPAVEEMRKRMEQRWTEVMQQQKPVQVESTIWLLQIGPRRFAEAQ